MLALYRPNWAAPWMDCIVVSRHPNGLVLREVQTAGRRFCGVWLATLDQVRVEGAGSFSPGARRITRSPLPRGGVYGEAADPAHDRSLAGFSPHDR
jgi:hypothetical protein